jgi:nucleolar MIF4G domain-containing protein 1
VTDVKKQVFKCIMGADDYLHAFEQLMHLNLKKTQEREIVRVLLQCCLAEKQYNQYYFVLSQKLLMDANYKYTFKYCLWDYVKGLSGLEVGQILNLAKVFG